MLANKQYTCRYSLAQDQVKAGMEISNNPFAQGDQIYEWANDFTSEVAHLAKNLDQVTQRVNLVLRVILIYQRRRELN